MLAHSEHAVRISYEVDPGSVWISAPSQSVEQGRAAPAERTNASPPRLSHEPAPQRLLPLERFEIESVLEIRPAQPLQKHRMSECGVRRIAGVHGPLKHFRR
jgi:hypothetical protein